MLSREEVGSVELVCHPEVAAALFASRRQEFVALEEETGKSLHVRVNDRMIRDQVDLYAYDERGADLPIEKFKDEPVPKFEHLQKEADLRTEADDHDEDDENASGTGRRRRRRRRKVGPADAAAVALSEDLQRELEEIDQEELRAEAEAAARAAWIAVLEGKGEDLPKVSSLKDRQSGSSQETPDSDEAGSSGKRRRRRRRRRGAGDGGHSSISAQVIEPPEAPVAVHVLAKEAGLKSTLLLDRIREELGFDVKSYMTRLPPDQVVKVKQMLLPEPASPIDSGSSDDSPDTDLGQDSRQPESDGSDSESGNRKKRRRRRRRGRGRGDSEHSTSTDGVDGSSSGDGSANPKASEESQSTPEDTKPRRPRRSSKKIQKNKEPSDESGTSSSSPSTPSSTAEDKPKPKLSRLRRSVRRTSGTRNADRE